jgi:hypothetical protein
MQVASGAKRTSVNPLKVYERTKTQVRLAASIFDRPQAEVVEAAMDEYVERHIKDFAVGLKQAREALFSGANSALAFVMNKDDDEIRNVVGDLDPDLFKPRRVELPRTKRDS